MSIWKKQPTSDQIKHFRRGSAGEHLDIQLVEIGDDFLVVSMPVDERTRQPYGLLHGGASALLAEEAASNAAYLAVDEGHFCVGVDLNITHMRAKREGTVFARAAPLRLGRTVQVWQIDIRDEESNAIAVARLTLAVREIRRER